eukprot:scaffold2094_cov239-Pinguiococcus_pyrenoidosus.AAC.11
MWFGIHPLRYSRFASLRIAKQRQTYHEPGSAAVGEHQGKFGDDGAGDGGIVLLPSDLLNLREHLP